MYLSIFQPENIIGVSQLLCSKLGVKVTSGTLKEILLNHPDYPSLLSISDTLANLGIDNVAIKCEIDKLEKLPTPFITIILGDKKNKNNYILVSSIDEKTITYFENILQNPVKISKEKFADRWIHKIVLLAGAEDPKGEVEYEVKKREQRNEYILLNIGLFILPILTTFTCVASYVMWGSASVNSIIYTILTLIGVILNAILVFYDVNQSGTIFKRLCGLELNNSCNSILTSKNSQIVGIKWSHIGFSFFFGNLIILIAGGILNIATHFYLAWASIATIPIILLSILYQVLRREFCKLCLGIQTILLLMLLISYTHNWISMTIELSHLIEEFPLIILSYSLPSIFLIFLLPLYKEREQNKRKLIALNQLKGDVYVFRLLLQSKEAIDEDIENRVGIFIGDPNAKYLVTIVSNPYCKPCGKAHKELEKIINQNKNIRLQVIFLTSPGDGYRAASYLLSMSKSYDEDTIREAMMAWYGDDSRNLSMLRKKYPISHNIISQDPEVEKMISWGNNMQIISTPTILINGYQLPAIYTIAELGYLLRN